MYKYTPITSNIIKNKNKRASPTPNPALELEEFWGWEEHVYVLLPINGNGELISAGVLVWYKSLLCVSLQKKIVVQYKARKYIYN